MKNRNLFLVFIAIMAIGFFACNHSGKTGLLIPKDADLVLHADLASLSSKLSWTEIQQSNWFKEMQQKAADTLAKKLLSNPDASGIDTKGYLAIFMKQDANAGYLACEGKLKDAGLFTRTLQQSNGKITINKEGNLNFATMTDMQEALVCFNNNMFLFITDASDIKKKFPKSAANPIPISYGGYTTDSLKILAKNIFALKGSDLLDNDERFADLITDKADMHYWLNSNLYVNTMGGMMNLMKIGSVLSGNIGTAKMNFENGKIVIDSKQYYTRELADLFKKYSGKTVSDDVINRLPEQNVLAAFAMNFSPEGLMEFIKLIGMDGIANGAISRLGISLDDFIKANKGDIAFALTDFQVAQTPASITLKDGEVIPYNKEKLKPRFVFGASVNDQAAFQKIINAFDNLKNNMMHQDTISLKHQIQNGWFALGANDSDVNNFLSSNHHPAYASVIKNHNGGGYIDLQQLIRTMGSQQKDTAARKAINTSIAFWKNATMYWDLKDGQMTSRSEVNLVDGNRNALKQFNHYLDQLYLSMPKPSMPADDMIDIPKPDSLP